MTTNAPKKCTRRSSPRRTACETLDRRLLMAAGDPDPAFNGGIPATISFPGAAFQVNDVALQSDGRIIAAGKKGGSVAVVRFNVDGTLDTTFGNQGLFESNRGPEARSVAIAPDGKIVLALGYADGLDTVAMKVARVLGNGSSLDTAFGVGGVAHVFRFADSWANAVAVQNDGKVVVAGGWISGNEDVVVARYNLNGSPDTTFDDDGMISLAFGADERASAVAIDYNGTPATNPLYGTIVAVGDKRSGSGSPSERFTICRLRPDGTADSSFDGDGRLTSPDLSPLPTEYATGVQIQPGGKIVVSGTATGGPGGANFLLARYLSGGAIDTTFGPFGSGIVHDDFGASETAVDLAPSFLGGLLVSGSQNGIGAVAAYTSEGRPETRFGGGDGFATTAISGAVQVATTLKAIPPVRRLALGGGDRVGRYIDVGSVVSIRSFDHEAAEAGQDPATFFVQRTQALGTTERVFLGVGGTARPPYLLNADYTVSGMTMVHPFQGRSYIDIPPNETVAAATITPVDDAFAEGDETIVLTISAGDAYDPNPLAPDVTLVIRDNDTAGGPVVNASAFVYDSGAPQRVRFTFSQDVAASIAADDLSVTGPSGPVGFNFAYDGVSNTATLSFGSILPDGNYTARAIAAGITNASGQPMLSDGALDFFFLNGDADRDRDVDIGDFATLASRFNLPGTFSQGDFNYSGATEIGDFAILASKFNTALPVAANGRRPTAAFPAPLMPAPAWPARVAVLPGDEERPIWLG